jgi:hypothetical protein
MPTQADFTREPKVNAWFTPRRFAVLLGLLLCAGFSQVIFGGETFYLRDYGMFGYPLAHYHREAFWRGEIPLLNPLNDFGLPFLAQWNTMTLYPGALIYLLFPLSWSLAIFCLAHLFLGGMGMYVLARHWTGSAFAGAVAGIGYAFNGLSLSCLMWPNNIAALGWLPWVVLGAERGWSDGGSRTLLAALMGAMQMLTGAPEIIFLTWLFTGALWLLELLQGRIARRRLLARFALLPVLVFALCAAQLLPFLELLAHSHRDSGFGGNQWPMPPTGWANFLVPLFYSFAGSSGVYMQYGQKWISSYYAGVGLLALALLAIWQVRTPRVWWLGAIALFSLVLALGDQGFLFLGLRKAFPFLGFLRFSIKFIVPVLVVAPLLAAHAVAFYEEHPLTPLTPAWRRAMTVWLALAVLIGVALWFARRFPEYPLTPDEWMALWKNSVARFLFLTLILGTLAAFTKCVSVRARLLVHFSFVLLLWLDVWTHAPSQNPSISRSAYEAALGNIKPPTNHARVMVSPFAVRKMFYSEQTNSYRTYVWHRLGLMGNCNLIESIPKVDGFYSLYLREERPVRLMLMYAPNDKYSESLADFASVAAVTAPGQVVEWAARTNYLPLATAGQKPLFADDSSTLQALADPVFDPRRVVYLPLEARGHVTVTNRTHAVISVKERTAHRIELEANAEEPSLVVLSQAFYHPWKARIGRTPVPILRANHGFQAVQIPGGSTRLTLTYEDTKFRCGAVVSLLTLASVGTLLVIARRRAA